MRISELAETVGIPVSTVRYYERVGLMSEPGRTTSGYRDYGDDAASRLLFISRSRRMGLSCDQVMALLPVWDGVNCAAAHDRVAHLVEEKQAEVAARIVELEAFAAQLDTVRASLAAEPVADACRTDLTCCVPESSGRSVPLELMPRH
jgi:DNA-binding transcriptional MerR regulator